MSRNSEAGLNTAPIVAPPHTQTDAYTNIYTNKSTILHGRQRHWNIGGSQVERRRRENRGDVGGEGVRSREGRGCVPSQKIYEIYEFLITKWCDMVHSGFWVCCF